MKLNEMKKKKNDRVINIVHLKSYNGHGLKMNFLLNDSILNQASNVVNEINSYRKQN